MSRYRVAIHVVPRRGLLDPQGKAVADALHTLGFGNVASVHVGRHLVLEVDSEGEGQARSAAEKMCQQLLANPVTEDFEIAAVSVA
jgi:phosphoribosylformylglycinamidine synthase PurS subunit